MTRASFDALVTRLAELPTTLSEHELLLPSHWSLGDDARLREDLRFRETPWGRWMLAEDLVANDAIYRWLHAERRNSIALDAALRRASDLFARHCVFCSDDPRFVLRRDEVHLAASKRPRQPAIEDEVGDLEKYQTHLPLHSLKAAAASAPEGEWGTRAQEHVIETLGWVRVTLPGRRLNDRMFIAAIEGHSMDDGKSGLVDGGYAVFELWPLGSRQNLSVLVRGAFSDPETGSYAVKKYVADQRDADGRHHKVSLVSLNANKERYPDIELQPEDDDDITVVARVVQALSTDNDGCSPRPAQQIDVTISEAHQTRGLQSPEGIARTVARIERTLARWFDASSARPTGDAHEAGPLAWLEVAPGHDGELALWVVLAPIGDLLPPVVRVLTARCGGITHALRRENAAKLGARIAVAPFDTPLAWTTGAFDEDLVAELARLALEPLPRTRATAFRADVEGAGQRLQGTTLAPGATYRLVVPRDDAWTLREVELPLDVPDALRVELTAMGFSLGAAAMTARWIGASPSAWRTNERGERYACFAPGEVPLIEVDAGRELLEETLTLFVVGDGASCHASLPAGRRFTVALDDLAPGRYAFECVPDDRSIGSVRLVLEVLAGVPCVPKPAFSLRCGGTLMGPDAEHTLDLSAALEQENVIEVAAPPAMSVDLRWSGATSWRVRERTADIDGLVDLGSARALLDESLARDRVGELSVDFGEWGVARVTHEARWTEARATASRTMWHELLSDGLALRDSVALHPELVRAAWVERVARALGYGLADVPTEAPRIDGGAAWLFREHARVGARVKVRRELPFVVVANVERASWGDSPLRRSIEALADTCGATELVLTNVSTWWRVDPTRARLARGEALAEVLADAERFADFACVAFGGWR
jgi:hypothetical protein